MNYMRPRLQRQTLMIMQGMDTVPFANKKVYFDKHTPPIMCAVVQLFDIYRSINYINGINSVRVLVIKHAGAIV